MKKTTTRLLALLLALAMALTLCACGDKDEKKDKEKDSVEDNKCYDFGDYQLVFKSACIVTDSDGVESFAIYFDFTNNSDSAASYGWTVFEKLTQGNTEMQTSFVVTDEETLTYIGETAFNDIEPGTTVEVGRSYELVNTTDTIKVHLSDLLDNYSYDLTFDPAELERVDLRTGGNAGTSDDDVIGDGEVGGTTESFGDFVSVLVPEGYTFERGDVFNEDNPHYVSVEKSDWTYFNLCNFTTEDEMKSDYDYVKKTYTYEQVDVSANYGGIDWVGFQYGDGFGGCCFELYAIIGNNYLRVDSAGLAFDDPIAAAVLGSIVMAEGDTPEPDVEEPSDDEWLTWWEGDWYGWWIMLDATGDYEVVNEQWWDTCAVIETYDGLMTGYIELWDVDGSRNDLLIGAVDLKFTEEGEGEHGTMYSISGQFMDALPEEGEWVVDPGTLAVDNIFMIEGRYEGTEGSYTYRVYLRPWGTVWDDLDESFYPEHYYDWYLPLIESGAAMPDTIG